MSFETKFRNVVGRINQLSKEEIVVVSRDLLRQLNEEKNFKERPTYIENDFEPDENWDNVNEQIKRSNIKRYKWDEIIGESLTKRILKLRKKELEPSETIETISRLPGVTNFLETYPNEEQNMLKNIRINVHARYGENNTADKLREKEEWKRKLNLLDQLKKEYALIVKVKW